MPLSCPLAPIYFHYLSSQVLTLVFVVPQICPVVSCLCFCSCCSDPTHCPVSVSDGTCAMKSCLIFPTKRGLSYSCAAFTLCCHFSQTCGAGTISFTFMSARSERVIFLKSCFICCFYWILLLNHIGKTVAYFQVHMSSLYFKLDSIVIKWRTLCDRWLKTGWQFIWKYILFKKSNQNLRLY